MMIEEKIQQALKTAVASGAEEDVQVAVYRGGELAFDLRVTSETAASGEKDLFPIFSCGKGLASTAVHRLVERGLLNWEEPIMSYWPEFAAGGKEGITLRHILTHTAGLPMMPEDCPSLGADWEVMCAYYEQVSPIHAPGEMRHYHAISFSWLLGETARRVDGRDFRTLLIEEVFQPLGIEDLYIGVPESELARCVDVLPQLVKKEHDPAAPTNRVGWQSIPDYVLPLEDWIHRPDVRRACIPASNGFGTAGSLAKHYAALIGEGVDGVRLLSEETVDKAVQPVAHLPSAPLQWGLGYVFKGPEPAPSSVFGHGGYGGSLGVADLSRNISIGIVKSRMGGGITDEVLALIQDHFPQTASS